jgi:acetyltransferase-like isoleucine patch superfamily enzyme
VIVLSDNVRTGGNVTIGDNVYINEKPVTTKKQDPENTCVSEPEKIDDEIEKDPN